MPNKNTGVRQICEIAIASALLCVSAFISIPLWVPITLQTLVLFLSLFILGGRSASISVAVYIALGALGLPVFSGFSGGIGRLFDLTGGYIFGMLLASLLWWLLDSLLPRRNVYKILCSVCALLVIYLTGTLWFAFSYADGGKSLGAILITCVAPFVIPDCVKLYLAHIISKRYLKIYSNKTDKAEQE
jgi:biotin transport system substrate-specific component